MRRERSLKIVFLTLRTRTNKQALKQPGRGALFLERGQRLELSPAHNDILQFAPIDKG